MNFLSFYQKYFYKVNNLVLPLLDIPNYDVNGVKPVVYFNKATEETLNTIIYMLPRNNELEYKNFEAKYLTNSDRLVDFIQDEFYNKYIFSVNDVIDDFILIKSNSFSKISKKSKDTIKKWHSFDKKRTDLLEILLNPKDKDFKMAAEQLQISKKVLEGVGEICSSISLDLEQYSEKNYQLLINNLKSKNNEIII